VGALDRTDRFIPEPQLPARRSSQNAMSTASCSRWCWCSRAWCCLSTRR